MSNNYINFQIPEFYKKYGEDWTSFLSIMENEVDYIFNRVWALYEMKNITKMNVSVLQYSLDLRKIAFTNVDTIKTKKARLRGWIPSQKRKGLDSIYLDLAQNITGSRGALYSGSDVIWRWNNSRWTESTGLVDGMKWGSTNPATVIFFDVKTLIDSELDIIVQLLRDKNTRPAFYQIYLVDSEFNILRTV